MYPQAYLSLFPAFPRINQAFVAMSFAPQFEARWQTVLKPALASLQFNGVPLTSFRVDVSKVSDAILTQILDAIATSAVIVADISELGELDGRVVRNANVLYKVGIAHAVRRPEEVILFRSDTKVPLDFDIQGVRIHSYDPDRDPAAAIKIVRETVMESVKTLDATRRLAIQHAARRLTLPALHSLVEAVQSGSVQHARTNTLAAAVAAVERTQSIQLLLELGAIESRPLVLTDRLLDRAAADPTLDAPLLDYVPSTFGRALFECVIRTMAPADPALLERMRKIAESPSPGSRNGD